jgi:quinol monooxygenase YgiN
MPNQERDEDMIVVTECWNCLEDFKRHIGMPHSVAFRERIGDYLRERITVRIMKGTSGNH